MAILWAVDQNNENMYFWESFWRHMVGLYDYLPRGISPNQCHKPQHICVSSRIVINMGRIQVTE